MKRQQLDIIESVLLDYGSDVKKLLEAVKTRNHGVYPVNCLNEIRAMNDHIARCYRLFEDAQSADIDDISFQKEIYKAKGHLQRLKYDCYKQWFVYVVEDIRYTRHKFYSSYWQRIGNGELWRVYSENWKDGQKYEMEAKINESIDASKAEEYYKHAFVAYNKITNVFSKYSREIKISQWISFFEKIRSVAVWLIITICIAVITEVINMFV